MRWVLGSLLLIVFAVPAALIGIVVASLEERPAVARSVEITPEQVGRAKRILAQHDPRKARAGALRTFSIAVEDLELALNVVLAQRDGAAKLAVSPGALMLWSTLRVPPNPIGRYLNIEAVARQTSGLPEFDRLKIGRVPVPAPVADWLLARALAWLNAAEPGAATADVIEGVRVVGEFVQVEYRWREDLPQRLRSALLPLAEQARLRAYQERLVQVVADPKLPRQVSLVSLLRPLLAQAAARSAKADAVAENRAAILVLAFYVNGRGLAAVVPSARDWPRPMPRKVTVASRADFAQHFTVSAALAATAGTPLADAVGLYKEIEDSRGGSGFSFTDIAADRAGTLFGERATRSPQAAQALQRRIAAGLVESDFMPPAGDLPEMLSAAEFKRRFGGVGEPPYRSMMQTIERRLAALSLYR